MEFKDYYQILGVKPEASQAEIKTAYRRLARKLHPDVSKEAGAEDRFKAVNEANEVLGDVQKRASYDRLRSGGYRGGEEFRPPPNWDGGSGVHFGGDSDGAGFSDFFESLFGRGAGRGPGQPRAGTAPRQAVRSRLAIDLETAYSGGSRRVEIDGRMLDVKIPAGIAPGQQIRLSGQGGNGRDLLLEIAYLPHPSFELDGRDIVVRLPILPWEAVLGAQKDVPTLGGSVSLRIPPDSDSGKRLRLRGRGLPGDPAGDQYVVLEIHVPRVSDERQRALYRELGESYPVES
jgi:curved DNA-binding protein